MNRIAICIPTYRREELLRKLLSSIFTQSVPEDRDYEAFIVVCDNDAEASARQLVEEFISRGDRPVWLSGINYVNNTEKGLCNVRNSLVREALAGDADAILFIDDDEYPVENWLSEMVRVQKQTSATVCIGLVCPYYDHEPDRGIRPYLYRPVPEDCSPKSYLNVGNTLIDMKVFRDWGLEFDMRFNLVGSEDTFLGKQIFRAGGTVVNAAHAIAYEYVPESRLHLRWHLARMSRTSSTWVMQSVIFKEYIQIAKMVVNMVASFFIAIFTLPLLVFPNRYRYTSLMRFSHVAGMIRGFFGKAYTEYSK